jgi:hypothetical protein
MYGLYDGQYTESQLSALRQVCLLTLDIQNANERLSELYDTYGEGDDEMLAMMMRWADKLEQCSKEQVMGTFARLSSIRSGSRNSYAP